MKGRITYYFFVVSILSKKNKKVSCFNSKYKLSWKLPSELILNSNIQNDNYNDNDRKDSSSSLSIESQIRNALNLSQIAANLPTNEAINSAQAAITAWEALLFMNKNPSSASTHLPSNLQSIGYVFYGHALAQCGRDILAEKAYEKAIRLFKSIMNQNDQRQEKKKTFKEKNLIWNPTWYEAGAARGRTLQRMQRYKEGRDQFDECLYLLKDKQKTNQNKNEDGEMNDILATVQNVVSAVTCSFRIDDTVYAKNLLEKYIDIPKMGQQEKRLIKGFEELYGLYAVCLWIEYDKKKTILSNANNCDSINYDKIHQILQLSVSNENPSPLYEWLYMIASFQYTAMTKNNMKQPSFSNITNDKIKVNKNNPFSFILQTLQNQKKGNKNSNIEPIQDRDNQMQNQEEAFLRLATINQCPFDFPSQLLLQLDNKVFLHEYLSSSQCTKSISFWPEGYIFPKQLSLFKQKYVHNQENKNAEEIGWMLKEPAAYGSYGNQIVTAKEASFWHTTDEGQNEACKKVTNKMEETILCQKIVHPPLLVGNDGRKFSMRVYVVLISSLSSHSNKEQKQWPWHVYLSNEGLVKLASSPYDVNYTLQLNSESNGDESLDFMHMTNSGRDKQMQQFDFHYLKQEFQNRNLNYSTFWSKISDTVYTTMTQTKGKNYISEDNTENNGQSKSNDIVPTCAQFYIPKILGFDFIVSENLQPWLIEVNRFPGLEPRDDFDYRVKHKVVEDAWYLAAEYVHSNIGECSSISSYLNIFGLNSFPSDQREETCLHRIL